MGMNGVFLGPGNFPSRLELDQKAGFCWHELHDIPPFTLGFTIWILRRSHRERSYSVYQRLAIFIYILILSRVSFFGFKL